MDDTLRGDPREGLLGQDSCHDRCRHICQSHPRRADRMEQRQELSVPRHLRPEVPQQMAGGGGADEGAVQGGVQERHLGGLVGQRHRVGGRGGVG